MSDSSNSDDEFFTPNASPMSTSQLEGQEEPYCPISMDSIDDPMNSPPEQATSVPSEDTWYDSDNSDIVFFKEVIEHINKAMADGEDVQQAKLEQFEISSILSTSTESVTVNNK